MVAAIGVHFFYVILAAASSALSIPDFKKTEFTPVDTTVVMIDNGSVGVSWRVDGE